MIKFVSTLAALTMSAVHWTQQTAPPESARSGGSDAFKRGQPDSVSRTAGGTSPPCTGLYCQDNPLGNPCPCPIWRPCKHDNVPDGHCMNRVNIAGAYEPCERDLEGQWTAVIAGLENTGRIPSGNCLCTAGSSDIYENEEWGNCNKTNPQYCDANGNGNACPPVDCEYWWGQFTTCDKSCGGGFRRRTIHITRPAKNGGKACPTNEVQPCNPKACPTPAPTPEPTPAPTQFPTPEPAPTPKGMPTPEPTPETETPTPAPRTPTPGGGGGGGCDCTCRDIPKVNGQWPKGYTPCRKTQCS